jgi:hypothetical protein
LQLAPLLELVVEVAPPIAVTGGPFDDVRCVPIVGGSFTGPEPNGVVLGGGADWQTLRRDGALEIGAHYVLETSESERVEIRTAGVRAGPPEVLERLARFEDVAPDEYYFRLSVRLATGAARLERWNSLLGVGHGERRRSEVLISVAEVLQAGAGRPDHGPRSLRLPSVPCFRSRSVFSTWWGRQSGLRLSRLVGPPLATGSVWSHCRP